MVLIGIDWDTSNIADYASQDELTPLLQRTGRRLPTIGEMRKLRTLPWIWDDNLRGCWIAEREIDLKNPDRSLFLPAMGFQTDATGEIQSLGEFGHYWSQTSDQQVKPYGLHFNKDVIHLASPAVNSLGMTVRGIVERAAELQPTESFIVPNPAVTSFELSKQPMFISLVVVVNEDRSMFYLRPADYSTSGSTLIITSPALQPGYEIDVIYAA